MPAAIYRAVQSAVLLWIDEDVLECEKSFLESFGYSVLTAASGGKGLELASKHSVDGVGGRHKLVDSHYSVRVRKIRSLDPGVEPK